MIKDTFLLLSTKTNEYFAMIEMIGYISLRPYLSQKQVLFFKYR